MKKDFRLKQEQPGLSQNGGHRKRLRDKFMKSGLTGFLDYEIVELLLTLGTPRKDCKKQAKEAMKRFKNLRGVLEASDIELRRIRGIGPYSLFGLKLIVEVSSCFLRERMMSKPVCQSSKEVFDFLYMTLRGSKKEHFKVLFLDAKNQILEERTIFEGTVDSIVVYPREVIKAALEYEAPSLIFVHNHPSGDPEPSESDREITRELVFASCLMQINVLDHIIIGNNRYFSFADHGLIEEFEFLFRKLKEQHM